jgi:hypothetical protein
MPSKGDVEFGNLALREKATTKERVEECLKYQDEIEKEGQQTTLDRVMMQKVYLTEQQVYELNKKQGRRVIFCSKCLLKLNVAGLSVGQKIKCTKCGATNVTPEKISFELVGRSKPLGELSPAKDELAEPPPPPPIPPPDMPDPPGFAPGQRPPTVKVDLRAPATQQFAPPPPPKVEAPAPAEEPPQERISDVPATAEARAEGRGKKFASRKYGRR